jgi:hypothetical protein
MSSNCGEGCAMDFSRSSDNIHGFDVYENLEGLANWKIIQLEVFKRQKP